MRASLRFQKDQLKILIFIEDLSRNLVFYSARREAQDIIQIIILYHLNHAPTFL